jgi:hypothetical protein
MVDATIATKSLVRAGRGRGFVVQECNIPHRRFVITAAHCLPKIPRALGVRDEVFEEILPDLLGPLDGELTVWAECRFVDLIGDVAVLGPPDCEHTAAYDALMDPSTPLTIGDIAAAGMPSPAHFIAHDDHLVDCMVCHFGGPLCIETVSNNHIRPGLSGSPILGADGTAIALVSQGAQGLNIAGTSPRLIATLPGWLLAQLGAADVALANAPARP